jgi:hypothetical protein
MSRVSVFPRSGILTGAVLLLLSTAAPAVQFSPAEIAERPYWEDFLRTAAIVGAVQLGEEEAVTTPWELTLQKDGVVRCREELVSKVIDRLIAELGEAAVLY